MTVGLELARALCVRCGKQSEAQAADFQAIDAAILEIEKRSTALDEINTWSTTIRNNSDKIIEHIRKARNSLERQVETLQERMRDLRQSVQTPSANPMPQPPLGPISWERMIRAVEKVRERLLRATSALENAGIPYAVVGGNAVAAWVSRVDEAAVRNTRDVDLLIRRADFERVKTALAAAGFVYRHAKSPGTDMFLDGPDAKARDAVHIIFAAEKVQSDYAFPAPNVDDAERDPAFRIVSLEALVRMKLTSYRDKDRTHLRDMIDVGLIDSDWLSRLPPELAPRLQELLDNPQG